MHQSFDKLLKFAILVVYFLSNIELSCDDLFNPLK